MLVCELTGEAKRAKDFFLLVQKPQVSSQIDLSRTKLASESRIHTVHERALRGIPLQKLESPPFFRGISANVEFFAVTPGQEWDYAIREGRFVAFDGAQLAGLVQLIERHEHPLVGVLCAELVEQNQELIEDSICSTRRLGHVTS